MVERFGYWYLIANIFDEMTSEVKTLPKKMFKPKKVLMKESLES